MIPSLVLLLIIAIISLLLFVAAGITAVLRSYRILAEIGALAAAIQNYQAENLDYYMTQNRDARREIEQLRREIESLHQKLKEKENGS